MRHDFRWECSDFKLTLFNSGSSTGAFTGGTLAVNFDKASDGSLLGGFTSNMSSVFGPSPLSAGFYTIIDFGDVTALNLNLTTNDIYVTQQLSNVTGSTRMGVASLNPVAIGSSPTSFYKDYLAAPPAGWYVFSGGATPAQLGYQIGVTPVPEPMTAGLILLGVRHLARRRRA